MVKHTQAIRMNCLSVFDHFVGLALKGFRGLKSNDVSFLRLFSIFNLMKLLLD